MMRFMRMATVAVAGLASLVAVAAPAAEKANWTATVTVTENGSHVLGNPDAPVKLTEFVSYTCPHCATFQREADAPMRLAYVMPGKLSVKIQHIVRDPIDLTVAMLVNCGDPDGFFKRHHIFLHDQDKWLTKMGGTSEAQRKRWQSGEIASRLQAIADDFDFYAIMAHLGYSRGAVNRCLADKATAERIVAQGEAARKLGVAGTPSFALNGALLAATHDWQSLNVQLSARTN